LEKTLELELLQKRVVELEADASLRVEQANR
jgi:hypothetical protein